MPLKLTQHENQASPIAGNLKRVFTSQASPLVLSKLKKIYTFNRPSDYHQTVLSDVIIVFTNTNKTYNNRPVLILNIYMPKRLPKYKAEQLRQLTSNPNNGVLAIPHDFLITQQISGGYEIGYEIGFDKESLTALFTDKALATELMTASLEQQQSENQMGLQMRYQMQHYTPRHISDEALFNELPLIMNQIMLRPLVTMSNFDQFIQYSDNNPLVEWLYLFQQIMLSQSLIQKHNH